MSGFRVDSIMEDLRHCPPYDVVAKIMKALGGEVIGGEEIIEGVLLCMIGRGHVLIEGLPGLAKTLIAKTFASLFNLSFKRVQFSPDLLPSDIIGTLVFLQNKGKFGYRKGPIFANVVLLDEINRAPAKVQSALLEAMEEKQITIGKKTHALPAPFFVLATENPIEEEGTYPLSEAQKDRFLMKLVIDYPIKENEITVVNKITNKIFNTEGEDLQPESEARDEKSGGVFDSEVVEYLRECAKNVMISEEITRYIVNVVSRTRGGKDEKNPYIEFGASPRASIALNVLAKILAMCRGRDFVLPDDVKYLAYPVLRHRIRLSYEALADGIKVDEIIKDILNTTEQP